VNKQAVLSQILATLEAELEMLTRAARDAFAAATDPDSKAENKYDTRTLESSYIARGQAKRVDELQEAVRAFGALSITASTAIACGSLVTLDGPEGLTHFFLGPLAGGTEIQHDGHEVIVITPASPLGQKLIGRQSGESILLRPGVSARIASVA
jgi:transcription elongation GreA/GreB family factor